MYFFWKNSTYKWNNKVWFKGWVKKLNWLFSRNCPRMGVGGGGGPPSVKIINFFICLENVQNALKLEKNQRHKNDPTLTLDILPGCWPHVLTLVKVSKTTQMNFPYHTESISQHVHHFKPIKKIWKKNNYFPRSTPFAENSVKIINLIFEPFPYLIALPD